MCTDLKIYGYVPVRHTHVLCKYEIRDIIFTLIVDDFGIKFTSRKDAEHLLSALENLYFITKDWEGNCFL